MSARDATRLCPRTVRFFSLGDEVVAGGRHLVTQLVHLGVGLVHGLLGDVLGLEQFLLPVELALGVGQRGRVREDRRLLAFDAGLGDLDLGLLGLGAGLGRIERGLQVAGVQAHEHGGVRRVGRLGGRGGGLVRRGLRVGRPGDRSGADAGRARTHAAGQVVTGDALPLLVRQVQDLRRDPRADLDLLLGLDFARDADQFHQGPGGGGLDADRGHLLLACQGISPERHAQPDQEPGRPEDRHDDDDRNLHVTFRGREQELATAARGGFPMRDFAAAVRLLWESAGSPFIPANRGKAAVRQQAAKSRVPRGNASLSERRARIPDGNPPNRHDVSRRPFFGVLAGIVRKLHEDGAASRRAVRSLATSPPALLRKNRPGRVIKVRRTPGGAILPARLRRGGGTGDRQKGTLPPASRGPAGTAPAFRAWSTPDD